jgi:GrpB-like predicted nucleotidyltransferase (UPF0157 family)/predicted phosphodiesterase
MRIAVMSDAHANWLALEAAGAAIAELGCQAIVHTGDAVAIGPRPVECMRWMLETPGVRALLGNHEAWFVHGLPQPRPVWLGDGELAHQRWLHAQLDPAWRARVARWPVVWQATLEGVRVAFMHYAPAQRPAPVRQAAPVAQGAPVTQGAPVLQAVEFAGFVQERTPEALDRLFAPYPADVVFYGHDHRPSDVTGRARYVNPGALGCGGDGLARFVVLDCQAGACTVERHAAPYDRQALFDDFEARQVPAREEIGRLFFAHAPGGRAVIGLERDVVRLVPYAAEWPVLYEQERARLQAAIGGQVLDIQHVGSTAVPGLAAKPILDIAVAVADFDEARRCIAPLEGLGYTYRGENGIPRRHYFVKGEPRTHHLHMLERDSDEWRRHLFFRDHLRAHDEVARAYARLKQSLAERYPHDRGAYTEAKGAFIARVLGNAESAEGIGLQENAGPTEYVGHAKEGA